MINHRCFLFLLLLFVGSGTARLDAEMILFAIQQDGAIAGSLPYGPNSITEASSAFVDTSYGSLTHDRWFQRGVDGNGNTLYEIAWQFSDTKTMANRFQNAVSFGEAVNWTVTSPSIAGPQEISGLWRFSSTADNLAARFDGSSGTNFVTDSTFGSTIEGTGIWGAGTGVIDGSNGLFGPSALAGWSWGFGNLNGSDSFNGQNFNAVLMIDGIPQSSLPAGFKNLMYVEQLAAVPEPSSFFLGLVILTAGGACRRWRSRKPKIGPMVAAAVLVFCCATREATAETHPLRGRGRTLVEAEAYSNKSSGDSPKQGESAKCSGKHFLGYFWANQWFELEVDVPQMLNYHVSLRASSELGTQIKVQMIDESGQQKLLATISVPKTKEYTNFTYVHDTILSLPKGVQTLRFENTGQGADVDYIVFSAGSQDDVVSFLPAENDGPDINPLKGFGSSWWREKEDYASVGFQYIEWGLLEPKADFFDWDSVEKVLSRPGTQGRHMILQFAVDWDDWNAKEPVGNSHYKGPSWLLECVGENRGPAFPNDPNSRISRATNYNHPVFIQEATDAVKALCEHFKDDPRMFVLQTGVLGYWGEWHTYPRTDWSPTEATKKSILDAYLNNLGPDGLTQIRYPNESIAVPQARLGYTNGSAAPTEHGYEFGSEIHKAKLWQYGPVGGEWPPGVDDANWKTFFNTVAGKSFLEQGGYSTMTPPEPKEIAAKLPGWNQNGLFMVMHRRMGYNFRAKAVRHLVSADKSERTHIEVDLHNAGIAPFYKRWDVQLAILKAKTAEVVALLDIDTDIREWLPNDSITIAGSCDANLDPSIDYQIGLRILQPRADKTKTTPWNLNARNVYVMLANECKTIEGTWDKGNALQGGWNILGTIERRQPEKPQRVDGRLFPLEAPRGR